MKLDHLTDADHIEAARLLNEVQDNLKALTFIINRAPWTDRVLRVQKAAQERLIDPLKRARDTSRERRGVPLDHPGIYPNVGYWPQ
jgi:hypothetical protein